jgi:hypothetical protein
VDAVEADAARAEDAIAGHAREGARARDPNRAETRGSKRLAACIEM